MKSFELSALMPGYSEDEASRLKTLLLNNTPIDDEAAQYIASCPDLEFLEVSSTKMTGEFTFISVSTMT